MYGSASAVNLPSADGVTLTLSRSASADESNSPQREACNTGSELRGTGSPSAESYFFIAFFTFLTYIYIVTQATTVNLRAEARCKA